MHGLLVCKLMWRQRSYVSLLASHVMFRTSVVPSFLLSVPCTIWASPEHSKFLFSKHVISKVSKKATLLLQFLVLSWWALHVNRDGNAPSVLPGTEHAYRCLWFVVVLFLFLSTLRNFRSCELFQLQTICLFGWGYKSLFIPCCLLLREKISWLGV